MTDSPTANQEFRPSDFAKLGKPSCSRWGKSEIEWIAHAYVQALANDGDTWKELSKARTLELVSGEHEHSSACSLLKFDHYDHWFDMVRERIVDSDGALSVGGFWNKYRLENAR